ncbi:Glyoxalase superfamily enzyme, possibly 3-demethylubiquinone-9 3-methyltransferase [Streptomyces zhaozhouensis]|uniref:Glyoxalase superfamily enzyme, possibly 3-demethylubiquinone-9 3-methyltransferase n=1 Tax=Streptomyces zhaozhouensis TaxID=1300267 RepID=A0A286EAC3_9ACTN|nr:VOC family protein [Streptomyces zhaozhouensis]SOD67826.1 Glyoxalase superfamily enzyme, possibly 3-demethylubiquinone-9 3-methyltransferase [Streptomyces zhaozhouensis]
MRISSFLWFDGQAEAVATYYTSLFADSGIRDVQRDPEGRVTTVDFTMDGQGYVAHNGQPRYPHSRAFSLYVEVETQEELDALWAKLVDGGEEGPGGSLVDRFGVTWQVMPTCLRELLRDADAEVADRVLDTLHAMTRIDIKALVDAHAQR